MRRLIVVLVVAGMALLGLAVAAQQGFVVSGRLGATDQEAQEGYFAIDSQTMLVVKPGTEIHTYLRSKIGRRVKLTIEPDGESE